MFTHCQNFEKLKKQIFLVFVSLIPDSGRFFQPERNAKNDLNSGKTESGTEFRPSLVTVAYLKSLIKAYTFGIVWAPFKKTLKPILSIFNGNSNRESRKQ